MGPVTEKGEIATALPVEGTSPGDGLNPVTPQNDAGVRKLPMTYGLTMAVPAPQMLMSLSTSTTP